MLNSSSLIKVPLVATLRSSNRRDLRGDLAAGLTVGAMLVPQAMAYALLAGLPPEVGLYASTIPVIAYALFGTSRQLAVGPVAIVSLLTATALAPLVEEGTASYLEAAALLALMVGVVHLVLGFGRLGFLVNFLSHSVLVGFTAAAAVIIGFSQAKHIFGISVPRRERFYETVAEVFDELGATNAATLILGLAAIVVLVTLKRLAPRAPGALVVVVGSTLAVTLLDLESRGVKVVGDVPDSLPVFAVPTLDGSLLGSLLPTALVITLVGFMESIAVAKVYARRNNYDIDANQELVSLGMANTAAGLFGGYPVTGGFSRTAVNATAGASTPIASLVTAAIVLLTIVWLTPMFESLPNAALGAIIIVAVAGLIDTAEMRHIANVKRSDLIGLAVAFVATLAIGIELGILVAIVASMLVVFARMSKPHTAVLGRLTGTTTFRNIDRFPDAVQVPGVRVVRIDAAVSFANATFVKRVLLDQANAIDSKSAVLVLDASGINDIDATGVAAMAEVVQSLEDRAVSLHLAAVKGPVRDVLQSAAIWDRLAGRTHDSVEEAMSTIQNVDPAGNTDSSGAGHVKVDEHRNSDTSSTAEAVNHD